MKQPRTLALCLFVILILHSGLAVAQDPRWTVPRFSEPPLAPDGGHVIEGTTTAPLWAWHASTGLRWQYDVGLADRASQARADLVFGLGFPLDLEIAVGFPVGWTVGSKEKAGVEPGPRPLEGMSKDGFGIGDLKVALLWSIRSAGEGGLGVLLGFTGLVPTGDHEKLMGEGAFTAEPFAAFAFQVFGMRLSFNLVYRLRPQHVAIIGDRRFEQDDDIVWRLALRVPQENDVVWSLESEGAVGILTDDGPWPKRESRPVWLGGGADFPLDRLHRLGMFAGFSPVGEAAPDFSLGIRLTWLPALPDEDGDGVNGASDECPLLKEDTDGFEDGDGCPDYDNDKDGIPDDEDECPDKPGGDFSQNGC